MTNEQMEFFAALQRLNTAQAMPRTTPEERLQADAATFAANARVQAARKAMQ